MVVSRSWLKLLLFPLLLSLLTAPVFADLLRQSTGPAAPTDQQQLETLVLQQMGSVRQRGETWQSGVMVTSDYRFAGEWASGMVVVRVPDGIHGEPDLRLFLAQRDTAGTWQVALEYTDLFYTWAAQTPDTLIEPGIKQTFARAGAARRSDSQPRGNGDARLSLPWALDASWLLIGGPHGNNGDSVRPWTALDVNPDNGMTSGKILAAREGYVFRSAACPNYVRIDHSDGWQTGYYHVKSEQVANGQYVDRGTWLGNTSTLIGCGGWASGPHTHFTLKYNGVYQSLEGYDFGGWTVHEGSYAYGGCMVRVRDNLTRCAPAGYIYNEGAIGSGYFDRRYDYDKDNLPDLWVVNQREPSSGSVYVSLAFGDEPGNTLYGFSTGMPAQPDWLNTAFAAADYNADTIPDLWVIHRWDSANFSAFRVMSGAEPQYLIADEITALPLYDNSVSFAVADYNRDAIPDLWAINPRDTAKNAVSVQIVDGANPKQVLTYAGTPLALTGTYSDLWFAAADYNLDGLPDLWAINARDKASLATSVQIISGKDWQTTLANKALPLPMQSTNIYNYAFVVADYNYDSYPDLWWFNRKTSKLKIFSGKDLQKSLYDGVTLFLASNTPDYLVLGSDHAREVIAPAVPKLKRPNAGALVTEPDYPLRWKPASLASGYTINLMQNGIPVASRTYADADPICNDTSGKWCIVTTSDVGTLLNDNSSYTWNVVALNSFGSTASVTRSFTTDIPGVPVLIAPVNNETAYNNVTLTWQPRPAADEYKLVLKNAGGTFKHTEKVLASACTADLCSLTLNESLTPDSYNWKLVAKNLAVGGKSKSVKAFFTVLDLPTIVPTDTATPEPTATAILPTDTPTPTLAATEPPFPTVTPSEIPDGTAAPADTPTDDGLIDLPTLAP